MNRSFVSSFRRYGALLNKFPSGSSTAVCGIPSITTPVTLQNARNFSLFRSMLRGDPETPAVTLREMIDRDDPRTVEAFYEIPRGLRKRSDWTMMMRFLMKKQLHGLLTQMIENYLINIKFPSFLTNDPSVHSTYGTLTIPEYSILDEELLREILQNLFTSHGLARRDNASMKLFNYLRLNKFPLTTEMYDDVLLLAAKNNNTPAFKQLLEYRQLDGIPNTPSMYNAIMHWIFVLQKEAHESNNSNQVAALFEEAENTIVQMKQDPTSKSSDLVYASLFLMCKTCNNEQMFQKYCEEYISLNNVQNVYGRDVFLYTCLHFYQRSLDSTTQTTTSTFPYLQHIKNILHTSIQDVSMTVNMLNSLIETSGEMSDILLNETVFTLYMKHADIKYDALPLHIVPEITNILALNSVQSKTSELSKYIIYTLGKQANYTPQNLVTLNITNIEYLLKSYVKFNTVISNLLKRHRYTIDLSKEYSLPDICAQLYMSPNLSIDLQHYLQTHAQNGIDEQQVSDIVLSILSQGIASSSSGSNAEVANYTPQLLEYIWLYTYDRIRMLHEHIMNINEGKDTRISNTAILTTLLQAPNCTGKDGKVNDTWQIDTSISLVRNMYCNGQDIDTYQVELLLKNTKSLAELYDICIFLNKCFAPYNDTIFTVLLDKIYSFTKSKSLIYAWYKPNTTLTNLQVPKYLPHALQLGNIHVFGLMESLFANLVGIEENITRTRDNVVLPDHIRKSREDRSSAQYTRGHQYSPLQLLQLMQPVNHNVTSNVDRNRFFEFLYGLHKYTAYDYVRLLKYISESKIIVQEDVQMATFCFNKIVELNNELVSDQPTPLETLYKLVECKDDLVVRTNSSTKKQLPLVIQYMNKIHVNTPSWIGLSYIRILLEYQFTFDADYEGITINTMERMSLEQRQKDSFVTCEFAMQYFDMLFYLLSTLGVDSSLSSLSALGCILQNKYPMYLRDYRECMVMVYSDVDIRNKMLTYLDQYTQDPVNNVNEKIHEKLLADIIEHIVNTPIITPNVDKEQLVQLYAVSNTDDIFVEYSQNHSLHHEHNAGNTYARRETTNVRQPFIFPTGFFTDQGCLERTQNMMGLIGSYMQIYHKYKTHTDASTHAYTPVEDVAVLAKKSEQIIKLVPVHKISVDVNRVSRFLDLE